MSSTATLDTSELERLKLISFNIQVGIESNRYSDYIKHSWRHVLPHTGRHANLTKIAQLLSDYDIVGLQEVDSGSLRSNYINQVEFLAEHAGFPHWHLQNNRNLARIAAHSNGLLSKFAAEMVVDHTLPGVIPGRGALQVTFGSHQNSFTVVVAHLALGNKAQRKQLAYIAENLQQAPYFVIMGDMNCEPEQVAEELEKFGLSTKLTAAELPTYPSWNPTRCFDQIIASQSLEVDRVEVIPEIISDHLPIAMEVRLPSELVAQIARREKLDRSIMSIQ